MFKTFLELSMDRPVTMLLAMALIALTAQVAIDAVMGDVAEYFNAARVFSAWSSLLSGKALGSVRFMIGQDTLGMAALPVATTVLFVQPLLYSSLLLIAGRTLHRFFH